MPTGRSEVSRWCPEVPRDVPWCPVVSRAMLYAMLCDASDSEIDSEIDREIDSGVDSDVD